MNNPREQFKSNSDNYNNKSFDKYSNSNQKCQLKRKLVCRQLKSIFSIPVNNIKSLIITNSVITVAAYIIMIEGLGKGVKYSLFVANAIIFVSFGIVLLQLTFEH